MNKYNHWIGKLFATINRKKSFAVTFGQTAYFSCEKDLVHPIWQSHEDIHKEQYKREGFIKFLIKYIYYNFKYGYKNNPFEVEARNRS